MLLTVVLNAADARPNDIHRLTVGGRYVRNNSNYFSLRYGILTGQF